jgi:hypothetical protein
MKKTKTTIALLWGAFLGLANFVSAAECELLAHYRFEENVENAVSGGKKASVNGNLSYVAGRIGESVQLDGKSWIDTGLSSDDIGETFTIEAWVRVRDGQNPWAGLFGNQTRKNQGFIVRSSRANTFFFAAPDTKTRQWVKTDPFDLTPGKWRHVAFVVSDSSVSMYLNGCPASRQNKTGPLRSSPMSLRIGLGGEKSRSLRGAMDEVRVWRGVVKDFSHAGIEPHEQMEGLARILRIYAEPHPTDRGGIACGVRLSDKIEMPGSVTEIVLRAKLQWEDFEGMARETTPLPEVRLKRGDGFRSEYPAPELLRAGYYWINFTPVAKIGNAEAIGQSLSVSLASEGPVTAGQPVKVEDNGFFLPERYSQVLPLDGEDWKIATDPRNEGREKGWFDAVRTEAEPTRVPWVIQEVFPGYHGVAWYWKTFDAPVNPHEDGRFLLRFHAVDYLAEVWLNGERIGLHQGGETPFTLDATGALKPGEANLLAVRVLNPTYEDIDGFILNETPHGCKKHPISPNATYNAGGIVDSVELLATPATRVEDLHLIPDWKSGRIKVRMNLRNAARKVVDGLVRLSVRPAKEGSVCDSALRRVSLAPGDTRFEYELNVSSHRLWSPGDPFLYSVAASVQTVGSTSVDERSARCGFRDFHFENGYFRLNGRRFFPHGNLYHTQYPGTYTVPLDEDMLRRDVVNMKALGINFCRIVFGGSTARQLDVFDELGVMVYMEHFGSWHLEESAKMGTRFSRSMGEIVRRDRNHPSVVMWGVLNEIRESLLLRHGAACLPMLRALDDNRIVVFSSGTFHIVPGTPYGPFLGTLSNPGSMLWDVKKLLDLHGYPKVPMGLDMQERYRTDLGSGKSGPIFITEHGHCGAVDLFRMLRHFENRKLEHSDDAVHYRNVLERFMQDWKAWDLDSVWPRVEDYFAASHRILAQLRRIGAKALRSNPNLVAYSSTYTPAGGAYHGSGMANDFRELKPGIAEAVREETAPLRWCLFSEPVHVYRGDKIRIEAVLSNHDVLKPGTYPAHLQVVGPGAVRLMDKRISISVPEAEDGIEPPFAQSVLEEGIAANGPSGAYRFLATLERGGAADGDEAVFFVTDAQEMPPVRDEVILWGEDAGLKAWLDQNGIRNRPFEAGKPETEGVILAAGRPPEPGGAKAFAELKRSLADGASVVFIDSRVFVERADQVRWMPLENKGAYVELSGIGFYRADHWVKNHPVFEGLPAGGLMDYHFYRNIIRTPNYVFARLDPPAEAIGGAVRLSGGNGRSETYDAGLTIFEEQVGKGRFLAHCMNIRENLGKDPTAERLLRNMLNHMARRGDSSD